MKRSFRRCCLVAALAASSLPAPVQQQQHPSEENSSDREIKLPSGKSQQDEILKLDHEKNRKDAAALVNLAEQLKRELDNNERHVLSVSSLRKTEEIEKIAKRIRSRLRRF